MKPIPRELIKHLEWRPGQEPPKRQKPKKQNKSKKQNKFTIDDLVNQGKIFYNKNLPDALKEAKEYIALEGVIATMPYLIAGKAKADKENYLWKNWFTAFTEENVGIDKVGLFYKKNTPVVVIVHGGGILNPNRIRKAYKEKLINGAAKYTEKEFDSLLEGKLLNGNTITLYKFEDIKNKKIPNPFGRYGIVLDFKTAKSIESSYLKKKEFITNPLVIARAGGTECLEDYFNEAKYDNKVGNWHPFNNTDPKQPQGRLLYLSSSNGGLNGNDDLDYDGRFAGVAPEAHKKGGKK